MTETQTSHAAAPAGGTEEDRRDRDEPEATVSSETREPNEPPGVRLHGVVFHALTESDCIAYVMDALGVGKGGWVVTANLDHLRRLHRNRTYAELCREATLVVADGMPLIWASRIQATPLPERVAGSNMISSLSAAAAERGRSVFLLGGEPGTAERAAHVLKQRHPELALAGTYCPPMGFEKDAEQMARMREVLMEQRPDIVYVALGSPKQERLIRELRRELPETWWMGVGISFSFLCGQVQRAPQWVQRLGLEWLHRLVQEPRRLARRYLVEGLPFGARLMLAAVAGRFRRGVGAASPEGPEGRPRQ